MKIEKYEKIGTLKYRLYLDNGEVIDTYDDVILENELLLKKELDNFMGELNAMCEYLEIEPKNLPINEEHPGNLTDDQRKQIFTLLKFDALSPVTKKIA